LLLSARSGHRNKGNKNFLVVSATDIAADISASTSTNTYEYLHLIWHPLHR